MAFRTPVPFAPARLPRPARSGRERAVSELRSPRHLSRFVGVPGVRRDPFSLVGLAVALFLVAAPFWVRPHVDEASTTYAAERVEDEPGGGIAASGPT